MARGHAEAPSGTVGDGRGRGPALGLYTRGGARLTGEQDVKGILREGYYGDLAVLSADYLRVPEEAIPGIES
ncbi:amidohydrolase family protein, partial [Streptomyces roseolus]|uniref:amidohydrolase family protein n=1 Tax=Streptomyces roseolus TaxID=67358 RepID=UPI00365F1469